MTTLRPEYQSTVNPATGSHLIQSVNASRLVDLLRDLCKLQRDGQGQSFFCNRYDSPEGKAVNFSLSFGVVPRQVFSHDKDNSVTRRNEVVINLIENAKRDIFGKKLGSSILLQVTRNDLIVTADNQPLQQNVGSEDGILLALEQFVTDVAPHRVDEFRSLKEKAYSSRPYHPDLRLGW